MIDRCYLEITNICNLNCCFCPKNERSRHQLSAEEFDVLTDRLKGEIKFLYFHLMGEPMLHPLLPLFVGEARSKGFIPILTTNGTLLGGERGERLIGAHPHKIQISLHSHEGNGFDNPAAYMEQVMSFAQRAAEEGIIVVLRLWNQGGYDRTNDQLLQLAAQYVPQPWTERYDGWKLAERLYIEYDQMFEWPENDHEEYKAEEVFCYALRNQIGVLVDGTVVPCCLDHEGTIALGNLFENPLSEILSSQRAHSMYEGFSHHHATEPLCKRCGYASVTKRFRKSAK